MEFGIEVWNLILIRLKNRCDEHESACHSESIWTCKLNLQTRVDVCYHHFKQTNKYATSHEKISQTWRWYCIFTISKTITFQVFHRSLQIQCCQLSWGGVNAAKLRETLGWYKWIRSRIACTCLEKWIDGSSMVLFSANNRAAEWHLSAAHYLLGLVHICLLAWEQTKSDWRISNWKMELFLYAFCLCAKDDCEMLWVMCNNFFWQRKTQSMHMPLRTQRPAWCRGKVLWMLGLTRATIQCLDWSTLQVQKDRGVSTLLRLGPRRRTMIAIAIATVKECHSLKHSASPILVWGWTTIVRPVLTVLWVMRLCYVPPLWSCMEFCEMLNL
jgi:hypothetical protein